MIWFGRVLVRGAVVCALCAACKSDGGSTDQTLGTTTTPAKKGSAGGFTASLSADLAEGSDGKGERTAGMATGEASAGSRNAEKTSVGSAANDTTTTNAGVGSGSAKPPATAAGSGSAKAPTMAAGAGSGSGSAKPPTTTAGATTTGTTTTTTAALPLPKPPVALPKPPVALPKPPVLTAELKAIRLSLLPNWKRDFEEAGTFSLFVDVQSKAETAVFEFHYGYDDPRAPVDRDAYKKFLADSKTFTVAADRQRGAAWYLEGTDAAGPAFRMLVTYGGKRLVCYGSLYKGSGFGDIRDEVIIQAKKICETIQL